MLVVFWLGLLALVGAHVQEDYDGVTFEKRSPVPEYPPILPFYRMARPWGQFNDADVAQAWANGGRRKRGDDIPLFDSTMLGSEYKRQSPWSLVMGNAGGHVNRVGRYNSVPFFLNPNELSLLPYSASRYLG